MVKRLKRRPSLTDFVDVANKSRNPKAARPSSGQIMGLGRKGRSHADRVPRTAGVAYRTSRGFMVQGRVEDTLRAELLKTFSGKVQLLFTSPPFPLNHKKKYGNLKGEAYIGWLASFAPLFKKLLKPDGSIVIELGNAWESGKPVMSTLALRGLLKFLESGGFYLCQQFVFYNPARLPGPAQWVNIDRIRVKDSYTHLWWMSPVERPEADNRRILKAYSPCMLDLLRRKKYNPGRRPSQHRVGRTSFLTNNGGSIPSNVLTFSNTRSNDDYQIYCREKLLRPHPARMPAELPEFFIKFLTKPRDLVMDPFAGSNTTGAAAEKLKRRWLSIEPQGDYVKGSVGRFRSLEMVRYRRG